MRYAAFFEALLGAIDAEPGQLEPIPERPDIRPMAHKLGCVSDIIVRSGLVDLGQRELLRAAAGRSWVLSRESHARSHAETLAVCSELIGYLSTVEGCRLPVPFPEAMLAFAEDFRMALVGLASRAAFALSTSRSRAQQFSRLRAS